MMKLTTAAIAIAAMTQAATAQSIQTIGAPATTPSIQTIGVVQTKAEPTIAEKATTSPEILLDGRTYLDRMGLPVPRAKTLKDEMEAANAVDAGKEPVKEIDKEVMASINGTGEEAKDDAPANPFPDMPEMRGGIEKDTSGEAVEETETETAEAASGDEDSMVKKPMEGEVSSEGEGGEE